MNNDTYSYDRMPNESDPSWRRRIKRHISKNAPAEHRYYTRGGKPGSKGQRWITPIMFIIIGTFFVFSSYIMGADVRNLNGPDGKQDVFVVNDLEQRYRDTKNAKDPYYVPVVNVRGESIVPLLSMDRTFSIGQSISLRYTTQGRVAAAFTDNSGKVSSSGATALLVMGIIFIVIGILVGKYYRGAVDSKYIDDEFARLTKTTLSPTTT